MRIPIFVTTLALAATILLTPAATYAAAPGLKILSPFWWFRTLTTDKNKKEDKKVSPKTSSATPVAHEGGILANTEPTNAAPVIPAAQAADSMQSIASPASSSAIEKRQPVVAGWLTPWDDSGYHTFKNNLDKITEVHPFIYKIGSDGVSIEDEEGDWHKEEVMRLARENNIKVIPTIAGDVDYSDLMLNDPAKRTAHIDEIVKIIDENGYDGFDIDYEGFLNGYNRDVYALFMEELSVRLHAKGKIVAIAIEAFNRKQNWEALGAAVDRFMIMGYDYHSARGPEVGAIGPANWLKEVVEYSATRVPREKIVLGLGTYGYSWIASGGQYVSEAVGHADALAIAKEMGASIQRGEGDAPFFTYDRGAGQRHLYFEDALSTKPKYEVAKDSGIAGIAFWRLGTEDPNIWSTFTEVFGQE